MEKRHRKFIHHARAHVHSVSRPAFLLLKPSPETVLLNPPITLYHIGVSLSLVVSLLTSKELCTLKATSQSSPLCALIVTVETALSLQTFTTLVRDPLQPFTKLPVVKPYVLMLKPPQIYVRQTLRLYRVEAEPAVP